MKTEWTGIHFLGDVFAAVVVVDLKVPNIMGKGTWKIAYVRLGIF